MLLTLCLPIKPIGITRWLLKQIDSFQSARPVQTVITLTKTYTLKDREWTCQRCNTVLNRDSNASVNIKKQGLKILSGLGTNSDIKQKRSKVLPLGESMTSEATPISYAVGGSSLPEIVNLFFKALYLLILDYRKDTSLQCLL